MKLRANIQEQYPLNLEAPKRKNKKAASEEKRDLKIIEGGLTSTMENMSNALAAYFPNPFDEAKKALEDMAVKSYAAVMADPLMSANWFVFFLSLFILVPGLSYLDIQGISLF